MFGSFSSTTFTNVVSKSITAPTAGLLLILGQHATEFASGSGTTFSLATRLALDGAQAGKQGEERLDPAVDTCLNGKEMVLSTVVPVTAGAHTVAIQIKKSGGGTGTAWVGNGSISALFVPFGSAGSVGTLAHVASNR